MEKRLAIYLRDGFRCLVCLRDLSSDSAWNTTLDHHVPRHEGGDNGAANVYTCCRGCNNESVRTSRTARALRRVEAALRKKMEPFVDAARVLRGMVAHA